MVEEDPETTARARGEAAHDLVEVVRALELLHDDALHPQVVAPDLLHQLGIVEALDEDAAGLGHLGRRVRDRLTSGIAPRTNGTRHAGDELLYSHGPEWP